MVAVWLLKVDCMATDGGCAATKVDFMATKVDCMATDGGCAATKVDCNDVHGY